MERPCPAVDFTADAPVRGDLDVRWRHGVRSGRRGTEPPVQVHHYDEHTVILRQSKTVHYEAPFLFLLFGNDRALLLDTGATADPRTFPLRSTVDALVDAWLSDHPRERYGLVVAHTHGHGDHVAGDGQFADRPQTLVVPVEADAVREFFGFGDDWTAAPVPFDLGGRVLELIGSPGHHPAAVTVHDPWSGILFTGDTVLPGRLFVADHAAQLATMERLVAFAATRPVSHVLGCHVEMSDRPGHDYPIGARYQPRERPPQMTVAHLTAVRDALTAATGRPGVHRHPGFVLHNEPRARDVRRMLARGRAHQVLDRLAGRTGG